MRPRAAGQAEAVCRLPFSKHLLSSDTPATVPSQSLTGCPVAQGLSGVGRAAWQRPRAAQPLPLPLPLLQVGWWQLLPRGAGGQPGDDRGAAPSG